MSNPTPQLSNLDLRPLPGSERPAAPGVAAATELAADQRIEITLVLRRRAPVPDEALANPLPREEFAAQYGADPADAELVASALTALGVDIAETDLASRRVRVSGTAGRLSQIFGTSLEQVTSANLAGAQVTHRQRTGGLSVPAPLDGVVVAVLGLDDRPQTRARFRVASAAAVQVSYTPTQLGKIYDFPEGTDGSDQTIGIIELGGGFAQSDLDCYFGELGITGPKVTAVGVDGAKNVPGADPNGADGEVLLDIEVAGALAPAANILVYFAPNTDAGFVDALSQAAHADPTPAAISISWGQSEDDWTAQARTAFDQVLIDAAVLGVTVTVASGDDGSTDRASDGKSHVDFPAASPHALACGGTRLNADPNTGTVSSEVVWNNGSGNGATGGGVSDTFPQPSWQAAAGIPTLAGKTGRGVPDVAGVADPQTGYRVRVDGQDLVIGGTSAVAPLWAALVARLAQATGRKLGLLQPVLYGAVRAGAVVPGFRDITSGNNGAYQAEPGWDACTGLGVPDGGRLLAALQQGGNSTD
ncbi:S53 family peptidase [Jatrophihabitans lederbergiae]|uniref:S53 family peptidase n=1 Tax=Jatrophihabitans lederbergiae TaxID=3075547 RepID=A0ABU2JAC5_9ACTN|nr:S53 family peptidase [Jatrophihabitans sp. DSM 44399]MDT0261945.1 S53 family peptidase [Jatrophihabitans sp. DSM 44399]